MGSAKFAKRRDGIGPIFVGSYRPGDKIEHWDPAPGNVATLRVSDVEVIVRITSVSGRNYSGHVIGFENLDSPEYGGLTVDGVVEFSFDNILSVMS